MKNHLFCLVVMITLFSCAEDDARPENELIGKYDLIEVLVDFGGGNGTFGPVNSSKTIEFYRDGTVSSNGNLCEMFSEETDPSSLSSGTYSLSDSTLQALNPSNCKLDFELIGKELIITYPCIEPCKAKYLKQ